MSQPPADALDVRVAMLTDVGRSRTQNQDAIGRLTPTDPEVLRRWGEIVVLADGVGGLPAGDLASQYAVSTILSSYYDDEYTDDDPARRLARAIAEANHVVYQEGQAQDPPSKMATTVVAAVIRGRELVIASVGDSPAFLLRDGVARQLTRPHTVENLAQELNADVPQELRHKLVRALGTQPRVQVDVISGHVRDGDYVVLCSDGLTRYVSPEEIATHVTEQAIEGAVAALVALANERGGADNISVIVLALRDESLLHAPDPMQFWGHPRRSERASRSERTHDATPKADVPPPSQRAQDTVALQDAWHSAWRFVRSNAVVAGGSMGALLVAFVLVMLMLARIGGEDSPPSPTPISPTQHTATAAAAALMTEEANLAATSAEIARLTLTPPTATYTPSPVPTSGPMLEDGTWFRVLAGDPIPAYNAASTDAEAATPLEADANYRVTRVDHNAPRGPWYQVVDNLGLETRWVSGPSLHQRVLAIDAGGNPLPEGLQPVDVPPPEENVPPTPSLATSSPALTGTPAPTTDTPPPPLPTATPQIAYGAESWAEGTRVQTKLALDLCRTPDVHSCDLGQIAAGAIGAIGAGPVASGEHWWWEVSFQDGHRGWVAQVLLESAP